MRKEVYIFSGLGADKRVFQNLDLSDISAHHIKWIKPQSKESIEQYASRLLTQINSPNPSLIGLSFGGLIAVEVAKQIKTEKVILISSAKSKSDIPFYYRLAGLLSLHKLLPVSLLKSSNFISNWFFVTKSIREKHLLKQILNDIDTDFLQWAIDKIVNWDNRSVLTNIISIHGSSDRILPTGYTSCDYSIKDGGHFMILNKAEEITNILHREL